MRRILNLFKIKGYEEIQPHHHHISLLLVGKILLVIALLFLIKPAFTGFTISRELEGLNLTPSEVMQKQENLNLEISKLKSKLETCNSNNQEVEEEVLLESEDKNKCLKEKSQIEIELERAKKEFQSELDATVRKISEEKKEIAEQVNKEKIKNAELEKNFKELADNSAYNICCKLKVDDKSVDSYSLSENKIVCGSGKENSLSC